MTWSLSIPSSLFTKNVMVVINRTRKDMCQKSRVLLHFVTHSRCRLRHVGPYRDLYTGRSRPTCTTFSNQRANSQMQGNQNLTCVIQGHMHFRRFYRAMLCSIGLERGYVTVSRLSVCLCHSQYVFRVIVNWFIMTDQSSIGLGLHSLCAMSSVIVSAAAFSCSYRWQFKQPKHLFGRLSPVISVTHRFAALLTYSTVTARLQEAQNAAAVTAARRRDHTASVPRVLQLAASIRRQISFTDCTA